MDLYHKNKKAPLCLEGRLAQASGSPDRGGRLDHFVGNRRRVASLESSGPWVSLTFVVYASGLNDFTAVLRMTILSSLAKVWGGAAGAVIGRVVDHISGLSVV